MAYNIHPIFVHFPIALLFIYSIIKIFPFKKWFPKISWKGTELLLLVIGVIGAFIASSTGETAEHLINKNHQLIGIHSTFAGISTFLYSLLLIGEIFFLINPTIIPKLNLPKITNFFMFIQKILTSNAFSITIAFLGLIAISITGLLGGIIVYGITADPIAPMIIKLLGITL